MLTIKFEGYPKAHTIIIDEAVNSVSGMVECSVCGGRAVLTTSDTEEMTDEIEKFIKEHECLPLARKDELIAFGESLKKHLPNCNVRLMKK